MAEKRRRHIPMPPEDDGSEHFADEFIIPATDEDGRSERCQFRCSARLYAWMEDIVAAKKFPFRRDGDLMRYGLYLACWHLTKMEPGISSMQAFVDATAAAVRRAELCADVTNHVEKLAACIADLQKKRAWGPIVELLAGERRAALASQKLEPYWGTRWVELLEERFEAIEAFASSKLETTIFPFPVNRNGSGDGSGGAA